MQRKIPCQEGWQVIDTVNDTLSMEGMCRLYPILDSKTGKVSDRPVYESTFMSGETKDFAAWKQLPSGEYRFVMSVFVTVTAGSQQCGQYGEYCVVLIGECASGYVYGNLPL